MLFQALSGEKQYQKPQPAELSDRNSCAGLNALKVCRVVKRCKRSKLSDFVDYRVIYKHRLVKVRTALHNSVTYGGNLGQIADCTVFGIYECIFNSLKSLSVIKHLCFAVDFLPSGVLKPMKAPF